MPEVKCAYCWRRNASSKMFYCPDDKIWICGVHILSGPRCPKCGYKVPGRRNSGCFLTTACVEHAGLPDDCRELRAMRALRDRHLANIPGGTLMIEEYYRTAPLIVDRLTVATGRETELDALLVTIRDAMRLIESGRDAEAFAMCWQEYRRLSARFISR